MANKAEKLIAFHGGLNDNTDPKDIEQDELASATDCSVSRVGRIGILGGAGTVTPALEGVTVTPVKDYGLFYFSTDRDKDGAQLSEDWIAIYNAVDGEVEFYYRDKQASTPALSSTIKDTFVEEVSWASAKPSFYLADGILRYSNGDFGAVTNNRIHQYVDKGFFQKQSVTAHLTTTGTWLTTGPAVTLSASTDLISVGDTAVGAGIPANTTVLTFDGTTGLTLSNTPTAAGSTAAIVFSNPAVVLRQGWVHSDQQLKSFGDIGVTLSIDDSEDEGPDDTAIPDALGNIILSYWTSPDGQWNGSFQFAASAIYHQGGIGPLTPFGSTLNFYEKKVSFQLHITRGASPSATAHPFGDDRIIGVRILFRSHGSDKWYKLKDYDLVKGGKFNWEEYDGTTHKAYGIFDGSIGAVVIADTPGAASGVKESYKQTTATFTVTNGASGFTGRQGFIRLWGPYNEPIWKNVNNDGSPIPLTTQEHVVNITTPGEGEREFQAELLDESFAVVAQSTKQKITISDSGDAPPPTYSDDADSS